MWFSVRNLEQISAGLFCRVDDCFKFQVGDLSFCHRHEQPAMSDIQIHAYFYRMHMVGKIKILESRLNQSIKIISHLP